jgi:hypothetical protein
MKKNSFKRKRFLTNKNRKTLRNKLKRTKRFRKKRVESKNRNWRDRAYKRSLNFIRQERKEVILKPKNEISLLSHSNNAIDFISELKSYKNAAHEVKKVYLDLNDVIAIDIGTISLMLSSIKELNLFDVNVGGNIPVNPICKNIFISSGYLEHMAEVSKNLENSMKVSKTKNLMLMLGKEKSESTKVGKCIKQAIEELTGKPNHYPPIYGIIQEMNGNSVEHAYKIKKHWILGINHDKTNNKMIFTFTDNGFGILRTLKRRFNKKVFDNLQWYKDEDILNGVFDKKYNSRFKKQYNRNKGLPVIKKAYIEDKINNLIVISNKAFLDFENKTSISLKNEFSGTFYYWELDLNTYRYGKNIN